MAVPDGASSCAQNVQPLQHVLLATAAMVTAAQEPAGGIGGDSIGGDGGIGGDVFSGTGADGASACETTDTATNDNSGAAP